MARPTSVTVIGILNIVFGGLGVICAPTVMLLLAIAAVAGRHGAFVQSLPALQEGNSQYGLVAVNMTRVLIVSALLIVAGIGLLSMKPWGRVLSIVYGILEIAWVIVWPFASYHFMAAPSSGTEEIGRALTIPFAICCGLIYPVVVLSFMFSSKVVQAFRESQSPPTATPAPPQAPPPPIYPPGA